MKTKTNFAREVQHFLLGAGLSLLVVAVTPVGARYLAEITPTGGGSGSITPVSQPVLSTVQPVTQPVTEPVKSEPTTVQQTQPAGGTTSPTQPAGSTGGITQPTQPTGGTTSGQGFFCNSLGKQVTSAAECDAADAAAGLSKPAAGTGTTSQQTTGGQQQQGQQTQKSGSSSGQFPGQGKGVSSGFPGQGKGVSSGFPGQGKGVQSSEGQEGGSEQGGLSKSRSQRQQPSFGSEEGSESSSSRGRSSFGREGGLGETGSSFGKQRSSGEEMESGSRGRSSFGSEGGLGEEGSQFGKSRSSSGSESEEGSSSRFSQQKPSSKGFFDFSQFEDSRFSAPKEKVKSKDIFQLKFEGLDTTADQDLGPVFGELEKTIAKVAKVKSKSKVQNNAIVIAQNLEEICSNAELDCEDVLDELADALDSGLSAKKINKALKSAFRDIKGIWEEGNADGEELELDLEF